MVSLSHSYVPTHCPRCLRAFLIPVRAGAEVSCGRCGGLAHVVPGEVYRAEDAILFGKIENAFALAHLPLSETFRIAAELGNVIERTRSPYTLLLRLLLPVPGLRFLEPRQPEELERLVRAMGMLLAIAAARAQHGVGGPQSVRDQERTE
jgi:hypothetical protein